MREQHAVSAGPASGERRRRSRRRSALSRALTWVWTLSALLPLLSHCSGNAALRWVAARVTNAGTDVPIEYPLKPQACSGCGPRLAAIHSLVEQQAAAASAQDRALEAAAARADASLRRLQATQCRERRHAAAP